MNQKLKSGASFFYKAFIAFVYFVQGFYLGLATTAYLFYPEFPKIQVLSTFSLVFLPFSLKYVTAPFVQKFTVFSYGRRKFWIIVSLLITGILSFPLIQTLTDPAQYVETVVILTIIILFISMGDICVDALAATELNDPVLSGALQAIFQPVGNIAGGLLIMKFSTNSWEFIGLSGPICTPESFCLFMGVLCVVVGIIAHFLFFQSRGINDQSIQFKKIIKYYLHFVNPKYILSRQVVYFLFFNQFLQSFSVGFDIQAVYEGFDKNSIPVIQTLCIFIGLLFNTVLSKVLRKESTWKYLQVFYFIQLTISVIAFTLNSYSNYVVYTVMISITIIQYGIFMVTSTRINGFGNETPFAGICITTLGSFFNLGNNAYPKQLAISHFGFRPTVTFCLIVAVILGVFSFRIVKWVDSGLHEKIHEKYKMLST